MSGEHGTLNYRRLAQSIARAEKIHGIPRCHCWSCMHRRWRGRRTAILGWLIVAAAVILWGVLIGRMIG